MDHKIALTYPPLREQQGLENLMHRVSWRTLVSNQPVMFTLVIFWLLFGYGGIIWTLKSGTSALKR